MLPAQPVGLRLEGRRVLLVGGGTVALRKARTLHDAGAVLRVVAPDIAPDIPPLAAAGVAYRSFRESDLDGVWLAVIATDDEDFNRRIAARCDARGVWANVAAPAGTGSCVFPAVARHGPLTLAVGTDGASPALAARLRDAWSAECGEAWGRAVLLAGALRAEALATLPPGPSRRAALAALADDGFLVPALAGDEDAARRAVRAAADDAQTTTDGRNTSP